MLTSGARSSSSQSAKMEQELRNEVRARVSQNGESKEGTREEDHAVEAYPGVALSRASSFSPPREGMSENGGFGEVLSSGEDGYGCGVKQGRLRIGQLGRWSHEAT